MAISRHRPVAFALLVVLLGAGAFLLPHASAATTPQQYAARLLQLVNQARSSHGLVAVTAATGTGEVADGWAAQLMSRQALAHNPDLQHDLETHGSPDWQTYGEVVGRGPADDPDALFNGYMQSSEHRSVILDPAMRFIGLGVRDDAGGAAWNVLDFVDRYHDTPTTSPAPAPAPAPAAPPAAAPPRAAAPAAPAAVSAPVAAAPREAAPRAAVATAALTSAPGANLGGWPTAVPLQHRNRAIPAALVVSVGVHAHWPAPVAAPAAGGRRPAAPVVVAALLVGFAAVGVLAAAVGGMSPARRAQ